MVQITDKYRFEEDVQRKTQNKTGHNLSLTLKESCLTWKESGVTLKQSGVTLLSWGWAFISPRSHDQCNCIPF